MAVAGNTEHPENILTIFREDTYIRMTGYWILVQQIIFAPGENFLRRFNNQKKVLSLWLTGPSVTSGGLGTVKVKMFDGVVRILGGMAYVPKLRKNLISLS